MLKKSKREKNKQNRIKKIKINRKRNIVIVVALIVCLCIIYSINFLTKSEQTIPMTTVNFTELETENMLAQDLELRQDEDGNYYILLPEKVQGIYAQKFYVSENINIKPETSTNEISNINSSIQNNIQNSVNQEINPNATIENSNTTQIQSQDADMQESQEQTIQESNSNEASSLFERAVQVQSETRNTSEIIENNNEINSSSNNEQTNDNQEVVTNTVISEDGGIANIVTPSENTVSESNTIIENTVTNNQGDETQSQTNTVTNSIASQNVISNEVTSNTVEDGLILKNNQEESNIPEGFDEYLPGEKVYINKEIADNNSAQVVVEYQTIEIEGLKLYKQELIASDDQAQIKATGYIPLGANLNIVKEDINSIVELKSDVEELKDSDVLLAYDIKIMDGEKEFQPKDYFQTVQVEIVSQTQLAGKINNVPVEVIHIAENPEKNEINFEKISLAEKNEDNIEFITNEFSTYAVLAYAQIQDDYVYLYDYDSDYNYYMGKNYTDNNKGENQNIYNDSNLAKVTINYYGYDYTENIHETKTFSVTPSWQNQGTSDRWGNRNYTISITANTSNNQFVDNKQNWQMSFTLPQSAIDLFLPSETENNNDNISVSYANGMVTLSANNWDMWTQNSLTSYSLELTLSFSNTVSINSVTGLNLNGVEKNIIGYVSADENERQSLFTYVKCIPITNNQISFELIDNPYMDRPAGFGFDGWTTNEQGYSFSLDNETKVQTLTVGTNGSKDITINLYANWEEANIVFIDASSGTNSTSGDVGLSISNPVRTWNNVNSVLGRNIKTAQNASNRELNIIVLIGGTLENLNTLNSRAYTLTSLYDGIDYRHSGATLNLASNFTLQNDLQLDYLNITGSNSYTSTTTTGTISRYIIGNARNLRIGRGMMPLNVSGYQTTFAQIQGTANRQNRKYRLVIESGKYANIQSGSTSSVTATMASTMILGCDYDRATANNSNLSVYNRTATRSGSGTLTPSDSTKPLFEIIVKSGTFGMDYFNTGRTDFAFSGIYLGGHSSGTDNGDRIMIVEGGNIANLIGGLAIQDDESTVKTCIYVKGGTIQSIVGGAGVSTTRGDRTIQVTDGTIVYSVSGGSNGYTAGESSSANPTGQLVGDTLVYIGGNAVIGTADITSSLYYVNAGSVLGAGNGNDILPDTAGKVNSTHVIIDGNAKISNSVYGGGNYGLVGDTVSSGGSGGSGEPVIEFTDESNNIVSGEQYLITNGTGVNSSTIMTASGNSIDNAELIDTEIPSQNDQWIVRRSGNGYTIQNASTGRYLGISTGWFGDSLTLSNQSTVFTYSNNRLYTTSGWRTYYIFLDTGWYGSEWSVSTSSRDADDIYFLKYTEIPKDPEEPVEDPESLPTKVKIDILGGTIANDVYGGANQNKINGSVDINMSGGTVNGAIYGGSNTSGEIVGATDISIEGGTIGKSDNLSDIIFGGGKGENTNVSQTAKINIADKQKDIYLYGYIYGGSALGKVSSNSYVNINDDLSNQMSILLNGDVYGGGKGDNATSAQNLGNINVTIDGGTFSSARVFGGCNVNGSVSGNILVKIGENYATVLDEVYGGGNQASITNTTVSDYVYLYKNSEVENAFNGGNQAGIDGDNTQTPRSINSIGATITNIYGGSNESGSLIETHLNISENSTIENVYGGGCGEGTTVTGNTDVNIENSTIENVYGGGNEGNVNGNTDISINTSTINNTSYGGGKAAEVNGTTNLNIDNSIATEIYGGGEEGRVTNTSNKATNVYANDITANNIYGGGKGTGAIVSGTTNIELISTNKTTTVNDSVYGGGNAGAVESNTVVTITSSNIQNSIYGGGNQASVNGTTSVAVENSNANDVYGGGNQGEVGNTTAVSVLSSNIESSVYGGGNQGEVKGNTTVIVSNQNSTDPGNVPEVKQSVFGGGKSANVNGTTVSLIENAKTQNVFGGGDQGEVTESTNVYITESVVSQELFGGGNGADASGDGKSPGKIGQNTNVQISNAEINKLFGAGKGVTAFVGGDTNVDLLEGTIIQTDAYGGGDNGYVVGSTYVNLLSPTINGSIYAAGNGAKATVYGDSHIYSEGTTLVEGNLYGGGNAAETGNTGDITAIATVDIAGIIINGNIYGGANSSQINGNTVINIGNEAINTYYGEDKGYKQGKIEIAGTIYGGGQSMNVNSDVWDDTAISVTNEIYINVYGDGYDTTENNTLNIGGSIFGSGNASNAAKDGYITIKNFGTEENRKKLQSIQRCSIARMDNSVIMIAGVKDSTSQYKETPFTFNKIAELKIQNNTTLYLKNGANRVSKFESLNADGQTYATVEINDDYTVNASSDNRIYMANGVNLNICYGDPQKLEVSPVKGMTFFGMYKSATEGDDDPDAIYKGIYDEEYKTGGDITDWNSREFLRTYVYGEHTRNPEQDVEKDGFYTNYEALDEGYDYGNISSDNYSAKSYTAYIYPTPTGEYTYYYWYAGPDQDTYIYELELVASKFSTLGAVELPFSDMNFPDATLTMSGIDTSGLESNVEFVNKNEIENISTSNEANSKFGLSMKTGNTGWSSLGSTDFYTNAYEGTEKYQFENAETTPSLSFFLHHSNNITEDRNLGRYTITMNLTYWRDSLNRGTALVIINIQMYTKIYEGVGYNTAITPGMQYDLFTGTLTNITTKSSFSAYFEMGEQNFFDSLKQTIDDTGLTVPDDYYNNSYRVISSGTYVFPENTTITMIDRYDRSNPSYYYYTVSKQDEEAGKTLFRLDEFLVMGSIDEKYSEAEMREKYYLEDMDYQYENFIFIVNFEGANFDSYADGSRITPERTYFEMFLRLDVEQNGETATIDLAKIINDQYQTTGYGIYKTDTTIGIEASLSRDKIYLGNDVYLNVKTTYNASNSDATIFDTRYFDKKLGVKLTFYYKNDAGNFEEVAGGTILGTEFELNGNSYYPRADGTTRIKIAELVSNSSSSITMVTENSVLPTGEYRIKVESFGSADGIYFGIESSASDIVDMEIVNDIYGLKSTLDADKQAIIDSKTGRTLNDEGYVSESEEDNKIDINLEYQSGLSNPFITVSLYRRNYDNADEENINPYDTSYTLVDLRDYVTNELKVPEEILSSYDETDPEESEFINSLKKLDKEYIALTTDEIKAKVVDDLVSVTFDNLSYELKQGLKTGTYRLVFKLYDTNDITAGRDVVDSDGNITTVNYNIREYQEIGDAFSYIIIK